MSGHRDAASVIFDDAASVIFDLDGTLIDSLADITDAVNRMLAGLDEPPMPAPEVQSHVGNGAPALVARILRARAIPPARHAALTAALVADYAANPGGASSLYPGVIAALTGLRDAGLRLGLCTNKPVAPTRAVLDNSGLAPFFPVVIGGDSLARRKPDPEPLLTVWRALGPGPAIFVGDSSVDAETAAAAALPFVFFTEGYLNAPRATIAPVAEFSDFGALPGLISRLFAGLR